MDTESAGFDSNAWHLRGVVDSLRLSPYRLNYWTPPGLLDKVKAPRKKIIGKVVADAMEALIGVFYEAIGDERTSAWLACLSFLPGDPTVRLLHQSSRFHFNWLIL